MKPRLEPALPTEEDFEVWLFLARGRRQFMVFGSFGLIEKIRQSDSRDADLMFDLQDARRTCDKHGVLHCILAGHHTALTGYDDPDISLVELGLAMRIPKLPERYR